MRIFPALTSLLLAALLAACGGIETQPSDTAAFAAGNYKYYKWRSEPLQNSANSGSSDFLMDNIMRREINAALADKGYLLDPAQAQFSVDYLQGPGFLDGVGSQNTHGAVDPIPSARPNRQIDQAMVDNAYALSGVRETYNIALQLNDAASHKEVWHVVITKIVENANETDPDKLTGIIRKGIRKGLSTLPDAS